MPQRRSTEQADETLKDYRKIFQSLFPTIKNLEQLKGLDRESLIELVAKTSPRAVLSPPSPVTPRSEERPLTHPDAAHLEHFQPMPEENTDTTSRTGLIGITDDVNALSLTVKRSTSYLGISSVTAALRVILWLDPEAQSFFIKTPDRSHAPSREASSPPENIGGIGVPGTSSPWSEVPLINAYFSYVHPIAPLLDEQEFRDTYIAQSRDDIRWSLLLNTVLALGSMANTSHCDEHGHRIYWQRAKQNLSIEMLGSAHIETVQTLVLLSGLYLHYIQEPNLANSLMGAAFRLAISLGLHRDYSEGVDPAKRDKHGKSIELRRRIWWSMFVIDSWVGYGLGRPSMGRMSHAISVKPPQECIGSSQQLLTLIQENIQFCQLSTRMEDALAQSPMIPEAERRALDNSFLHWYNTSSAQNNTPRAQPGEPHGISVVKNIMRWRYVLCRIILHRPVLLWAAMRKTPFAQLLEEKRYAVEICREMTFELINDIATTWRVSRPCSMAGWNATWLLYQALMVPLLHLFADRSNEAWNQKNQNMIEVGLAVFVDLRSWSQTAGRSAEVVDRIYRACRRHELIETKIKRSETISQQSQMSGPLDFTLNDSPTQEVYMNNVFDSLNWSDNWVDESFPYTQAALQFDQGQEELNSSCEPFMTGFQYDDPISILDIQTDSQSFSNQLYQPGSF
ncbi:hypothetical protein LTR05_008447 [Lithohypha guttulata]|uniref:Xylanolytic transcriptional activator regulatory domain-containing protein n=1 Tax=Lithohypha guttulata TaxID=1690604 RepID=A0AAN7SRZ3_9EURO|nr:hypothetical protein LTR05_008447 [Lithohypha guttulata]